MPDLLVPDTTAPTISRWFLDNSTFTFYAYFSEPITIANITAISIATASSLSAKSIHGYLKPLAPWNYSNFATKVSLELDNYCIYATGHPSASNFTEIAADGSSIVTFCPAGTISFFSLVNASSLSKALYLMVNAGAIVDLSPAGNSLAATSSNKLIQAGTPGESTVYIDTLHSPLLYLFSSLSCASCLFRLLDMPGRHLRVLQLHGS